MNFNRALNLDVSEFDQLSLKLWAVGDDQGPEEDVRARVDHAGAGLRLPRTLLAQRRLHGTHHSDSFLQLSFGILRSRCHLCRQ